MTLQEIIRLIYEKTIPELKQLHAKGADFKVIDPYDQNNVLIAYSGQGYSDKYEQTEMVDFLLSCGLDINYQKNKRGYELSALHMAVANHHLKIVQAIHILLLVKEV
ncbi:MAG: ankyrin repeat domain-containing protein [Saprospiraceae bacterium]|nr:ankyrin repeat domain-containing protein [Saprospiraceae bacterium]